MLDNGAATSDEDEFNEKFKVFYSDLCSFDDYTDFNVMGTLFFFQQLSIPHLPDDLRYKLGEPISEEDITSAVLSMQSSTRFSFFPPACFFF